jgi:hypothetical protein
VVLDHVLESAGALVVAAAALDAETFRHGDLDVVDVSAVPDGLEDAVGEAEDEDVLDGLLAQVMVDAVNLILIEDGLDRGV